MTDFLATLALRGAGLAPSDGRGALAPRPRATFEPDVLAPAADAMPIERTDEAVAPRPPGTAWAAEPRRRPHAEVATLHETRRDADEARHPAAPAPAPVTPATVDAAPRHAPAAPAPVASKPPADPRPAPRTPARARATEAPPWPAARPGVAPSPPQQAVVTVRTTPDGPSAATADVQKARPAPAARPARGVAPARPVERPAAPPPPVTVSIGRIDVEVAPPPRPTAPAQRPGPERTRGFDHYARARRGRPRS